MHADVAFLIGVPNDNWQYKSHKSYELSLYFVVFTIKILNACSPSNCQFLGAGYKMSVLGVFLPGPKVSPNVAENDSLCDMNTKSRPIHWKQNWHLACLLLCHVVK